MACQHLSQYPRQCTRRLPARCAVGKQVARLPVRIAIRNGEVDYGGEAVDETCGWEGSEKRDDMIGEEMRASQVQANPFDAGGHGTASVDEERGERRLDEMRVWVSHRCALDKLSEQWGRGKDMTSQAMSCQNIAKPVSRAVGSSPCIQNVSCHMWCDNQYGSLLWQASVVTGQRGRI